LEQINLRPVRNPNLIFFFRIHFRPGPALSRPTHSLCHRVLRLSRSHMPVAHTYRPARQLPAARVSAGGRNQIARCPCPCLTDRWPCRSLSHRCHASSPSLLPLISNARLRPECGISFSCTEPKAFSLPTIGATKMSFGAPSFHRHSIPGSSKN
jgi:hypothetical protein